MRFPMIHLFALALQAGTPPAFVDGADISPSVSTSQATSTGAVALYANISRGTTVIGSSAGNIAKQRVTCYSASSQLFAVGNACWFTLVSRLGLDGVANVIVLKGLTAAVATAAPLTYDELHTAVGFDDFAVIGAVRFHRSADTVIDTAVSYAQRRPLVDSDSVAVIHADSADTSTLSLAGRPRSIDFSVSLVGASTLSAGDKFIDSAVVQTGDWGAAILGWEYIPGLAGAGAGADLNFRLHSGSTELGDSTRLNITLARSALGQHYGVVDLSSRLKLGSAISVELDVKTAVFSAGTGTLRIFIDDYVG